MKNFAPTDFNATQLTGNNSSAEQKQMMMAMMNSNSNDYITSMLMNNYMNMNSLINDPNMNIDNVNKC